MKQSKTVTRTAAVTGDTLLRSVRGGGTPLPSFDDDLRRGPVEGTPLPAIIGGDLRRRGPVEGTPLPA